MAAWMLREATASRMRTAALGVGLALIVPPAAANEAARDLPARSGDTARTPALAQSSRPQAGPTIRFDIPGQPLPTALLAFGRQAGLQVTVDAAITAGKDASFATASITVRASDQ